MNKSEILAFLNEHPNCFLATVEGNKPHVRGMMLHKADENGIVFQTFKVKDVHKQLQKNKEAELCFNSQDKQIRVSGQMELVEDPELRNEVFEKRPFLKPLMAEKGLDFLAIYRMKNGRAIVWTIDTNLAPKTYVTL